MSQTIASMRARLNKHVTDWQEDQSHPPNYIRETGMGQEVARVDRWCGGYQDVHKPVMIGWQARNGNQVVTGIVMVDGSVDSAILTAKATASKALFELRGER